MGAGGHQAQPGAHAPAPRGREPRQRQGPLADPDEKAPPATRRGHLRRDRGVLFDARRAPGPRGVEERVEVKNALSSTIALFVVGACLLIAGLLMVRASIRARLAYRRALKTRRRVAGKVVGHKTHADEGSTLWSPV